MFSSILIPIAILIVFRVFKALQQRSKLPPGPLGLPVFGNLFQLPTSRPWLAFDNWAKQYGPIVYLNIAGQNTIVLNSHKTAADLLERRATIYSDWPDFIVLSIITGGWMNFGRGNGEGLTIYGWPPLLDSHHPTISGIDRFNADLLEAAAPGSFWMCTWKRNVEESFVRNTTMFERLASDVQKELDAGNDTPNVVGKLLQDTEKPGIIEIAWNAALVYSAGAETSAGQLTWFIQAMIFYPETQRIAQDEIDRVVGPYRMPTFADYEHLPYIRATVKEILRWRGVSPIGLPHRLNQDDFYEGYFIPKDTVCFVNNWSLHRDKELYGDDAEHFNPGRFLDIDGNVDSLIAGSKDEGHFSYGFGKRICVGRHVANNSLFIHIASLLWAFNIAAEVGRDGRLNFPDSLQCKEGLIVRPAPFRCKINARRMDIAAIVAQAKADRGIQPGRTERSI
ncbi:cytochrome P450 [Lentinula raphanica]|nr:cytochrome P450 [Lentinula raphanica]